MKLSILSVLALACCLIVPAIAQSTDSYIIEVSGYSWNKTTLRALIVTSENETWWNSGYLNSTLRAIDDWNYAITYFSSKYSDLGYMRQVKLVSTISNESETGYDVIINFTESLQISGTDAIGLETKYPLNNGTVLKSVVTLSSRSSVLELTQKDIQSVATHELAHSLGIGHSNMSSDPLYPSYDIYSSGFSISSLDFYGVSQNFRWLNQTEQGKVNTSQFEVSLPNYMTYELSPVSQLAPTTLADNWFIRNVLVVVNIILSPFIFPMLIILIILLIAVIFTYRKRRKRSR